MRRRERGAPRPDRGPDGPAGPIELKKGVLMVAGAEVEIDDPVLLAKLMRRCSGLKGCAAEQQGCEHSSKRSLHRASRTFQPSL